MPKKSQTMSPKATISSTPRESKTESRKKDHIEIALKSGAQYEKSSGFERFEYEHCALPELDLDKVDLSTKFLGRQVRYPLVMEAMTGGYPEAKKINRELAAVAQKHGIAFALGSQRAMLETPALRETYRVRDIAPDIPIIGNIGAVQLKKYPVQKVLSLVSAIEADALAVHLNPLQEAIQPEGDHDFSGVLDAISNLCDAASGVPIIVKETGAGISQPVALKLKEAGVSMIDVAGSGGTSWSRVEYLRKGPVPGFGDWGIPTAESVQACKGVLPIIASGGIRNGIDACKAITLGADLAGAAYPFLKAWKAGTLGEELCAWESQMRLTAFLTGSHDVEGLRQARMIVR